MTKFEPTDAELDPTSRPKTPESAPCASGRSRRWVEALETLKTVHASELPPHVLAAIGGDFDALSATLPASTFFEALEQTSLAITITDPEARILYVNSAFETLTGYGLENLIGQRQSINSHNKTPLTVYKDMWETILAGRTWRGRLLNRRADGEAYVVDLMITPICGYDGEIRYFLGVHSDATEHHKLERKLSNQKNLTETVINLAPVAMALVDTDGGVILDNLAYKTLMGDLKGAEPAELFLDALKSEIGDDLKKACRKNKTFANIEVSLDLRGGGGQRWFSCSGEWVKEFDVAPDSYFQRRTKDALLLCCTDITQQRREYQRAKYSAVRAMMVEQQMSQRIREIVSAATFQMQGPLNVIKAMGDMLRRQQRADPSIETALAQVLESGGQAIKMLENVTPQGADEPMTNVHVNEILRDVLVLSMEQMTAADVAVDWHPSREPLHVMGRANALRNMFKNILDNASDAIEHSSDPWRKVRVVTRRSPDGQAEICIEDSGPGMPREIRSRAFEPFFSGWTKLRGKAGIGLAIARQVATDHGGAIEIDDRYRRGCRVRILLPLVGGSAAGAGG